MDFFFCMQDTDLYEGMDAADLSKLPDTTNSQVCLQGEILFSPENPAKDVFILKEGEVELYLEENGKKITIETIVPGEVFGNCSNYKTVYTARVARKSFICKTPKKVFMNALAKNNELCFRFMQLLADRLTYSENRLASLVRPAKQQIIDELVRMKAKEERTIFGKIFRFPVKISHQALAERVGLNRVTVTRILGDLKKENIITLNPKTGEIKINV